jgi:SNF2 family DNA or RNA helicase
MGHGLNLQKSSGHVCWFSLVWNYELYDQFNRRVWRQGAEGKRVVIYRILARDTVDELIANRLSTKESLQDQLLESLKALRGRRKC